MRRCVGSCRGCLLHICLATHLASLPHALLSVPCRRCRVWFLVSRLSLSAAPSQTALLMSAASQGPHRALPEGSSGQFHSVLHGFCLRPSSRDYADGQVFAFLLELARSLTIASFICRAMLWRVAMSPGPCAFLKLGQAWQGPSMVTTRDS